MAAPLLVSVEPIRRDAVSDFSLAVAQSGAAAGSGSCAGGAGALLPAAVPGPFAGPGRLVQVDHDEVVIDLENLWYDARLQAEPQLAPARAARAAGIVEPGL